MHITSRRLAAVIGIVCVTQPGLTDAHSFPAGDQIVNPERLAADRDSARLNFLARQAKRNGVSESTVEAARSIFYNGYRWAKSDLKVCFWNGTEEIQREVMQIAAVWTDAVPSMKFVFEENGKIRRCQISDLQNFSKLSDIRITLLPDERSLYHPQDLPQKSGDWAYPGRAVSQDVRFPTTMNLVGALRLREKNLLSDYYFNVRHEFGHALSLAHEHQRAICKGWFNIKAIAKETGWSETQAAAQVDSIDESSNAFGFIGAYNPESIMQYNFAPSWYQPDLPGKPNPCRRRNEVVDLSDMDKYVVAALYEPSRNESPTRKEFIIKARAEAAQRMAALPSTSTTTEQTSQAASIESALRDFERTMKSTSQITIQIYPHKVDEAKVMTAISNLGYPLIGKDGVRIRNVSKNTNPSLRDDPTNTLLYTPDVSDQDVRYIALALVSAGIKIRSIQPYRPHKRNGNTNRSNLVQIGADVTNRNRAELSVNDILDKKLPIYGNISR